MKKKTISVVLASVMVICALGGCSSSSSSSDTAAEDSEEEEEAEEEAEEETAEEEVEEEEEAAEEATEETAEADSSDDVLVVDIWSSDASKEATYTELFAEYNETIGAEEGISLELTVSSEVYTMLQLAQENDELPLITDQRDKRDLTWEDGGYCVPFSALPGGEEFVEEWMAKVGDVRPYGMYSGSDEVYQLPYSVTGPALYYNKEKLVEAGLVDEDGEAKPPETWSEFVEYCEILTTDSQYGLAMSLGWSSYAEYAVMYTSFNALSEKPVTIDWEDETVQFNFGDQIEAIATIYQNGWCVPGAESIDNDPARSYFSEGVAAMFIGYSWDIGVFTSQYVAEFDWDLCQLAAEDGTSYGTRLGLGNHFYATTAAMDLSESDQEKVMSVLEWLYSDDVCVALVEAGLIYPINTEVLDKLDSSKLSTQTNHLLEQLSEGRYDIKIEYLWSNVDYDNGNGAGLLNDDLILLCQGAMTVDEYLDELDTKFSEALQAQIAEGNIDPESWSNLY